MSTRLVFVRHAEQPPDGRFWQHGCPGLTGRGHQQAASVAQRIATSGEFDAVHAVWRSRAARSILTSDAIAASLASPLTDPTCDLCEMHPGEAEGLTNAEMTERFGPHYGLVPGAEAFRDWLPAAVTRLKSLSEISNDKTIVAVTHTAVLVATFVAFGELTADEARTRSFDFTSITEWSRESDQWACVRENDCGHLSSA